MAPLRWVWSRFATEGVRLLASAVAAQWIAVAAHGQTAADPVLFFTKRVDQLTGSSGAGKVMGQDSAVAVHDPRKESTVFLFGDTWTQCELSPNSMASTTDADASDGIELVYHEDASGRAIPPLAKDPATGEASVWPEAPFLREADLCVFYYMMPPTWPDHAPEDELGGGIACTEGGSAPLARLGANVLPDYPQFLGPKNVIPLGKKWLVFFVNEMVEGLPRTFLARSASSSVGDFSSYTYWDGRRWSGKPGDRVHVFSNLSPPSVAWNDHLGAWVAIGSLVLSPDGLSSRIGLATADSFTGPWSEPVPLYGESDGGTWGSVYNAFRTAAFDQEGGRRMFTTATHSQRYNVDLFETSIGYAESHFCLASSADDADQRAGEETPSASGVSLLLAPSSASMIGLRLTGPSWVQGAAGGGDPLATPAAAAASLVLPLAEAAAQSFSAKLLVRVGAPNDPPWAAEADLFEMPPVAEIVVDVAVAAGASEITIGNEAAAVFTAVIQRSEWSPGYDNVVPITLSRLDDYPLDLRLAGREGGPGVEAWLCHGACPAAPRSMGADCRPPARFVESGCSVKVKQPLKSCGLGGELVLLLPVVVFLRRARRRANCGPWLRTGAGSQA
jgi:hypothetical protein